MKRMKGILIVFAVMIVNTGTCFSAPNLAGEYLMSNYSDETDWNNPWASLNAISIDGSKNGTFEQLYSSDGETDSGTFTYSVSSDGMLTVKTPDGNKLHGIVSVDGDVFAISETGGDEPGIDIAVKKSTGLSNADLTGEYIITQIGDNVDWNNPLASLSALNLDGNGNGTFEELYVSNNGSLGSGTLTYSVASNGQLTVTAPNSHILNGILNADGSLFILSGTDTDDPAPGIYIGVKKSSGLSNLSLFGDYIMCQFNDESFYNDPWASLAAISVDGNGNGTYKELSVSDNDPLEKNGAFTYSVNPDGTFTIMPENSSETLNGIVSPDGQFFTISGTDGDEPGIMAGIKKGPNPACISTKIKAAATLCKGLLACEMKKIADLKGNVNIAPLIAKSEDKFNAGWDKAEQNAVNKGSACATSPREKILNTIGSALDDLCDQICSGLSDTSNRDAAKLGKDLLKAASTRCYSLLKAESTNVKKPDSGKLKGAIDKADAKFEAGWTKALEKASNKNVLYNGLEMPDVMTSIDDLVLDILSGLGLVEK